MKRIFIFILVLATSSAFAALDFKSLTKKYNKAKKVRQLKGGAMDGGGSGSTLREEEGAAWFYKDKPSGFISVCVNRSAKFKTSETDIIDIIKTSFKNWDHYINASSMYDPEEHDDGTIVQYPEKMKILSKIKFEKCSATTEVTFYFGVKDKRVNDVLTGLSNPKGFAFRNYDDIDSIKGSSKGIVWIFDPSDTDDLMDDVYYDWSNKNLLQALLTHEIGHIMGVGHFEGTIMQENLRSLFLLSQMDPATQTDDNVIEMIAEAKKNLGKIDHKSKLLENFNFSGKAFNGKLGLPNSKELKDTFNIFMKRDPKGDVKVTLKEGKENSHMLEYILKDDAGSKVFEITKLENDTATFNFGYPINKFKRVRKSFDPSWGSYDFDSRNEDTMSASLKGIMHIKGMKPIYAMLGINPGSTGYFEKGNSSTSIVSTSTLSLHFIDTKLKTRIMFVSDIYDFTVIEDDIDPNTGDVIIGSQK